MLDQKKMTDAEFAALYLAANTEGKDAVARITYIRPMHVSYRGEDGQPRTDTITDGPCGFAWVNIKPGTSRFARYLVKAGLASKDSYYGGVTIWIGDYNQSMAKKECHAHAMAKALRAAGIEAHGHSRMD